MSSSSLTASFPRASTITLSEFTAILSRYSSLLSSVSASKTPKASSSPSSEPTTLAELDHYRLHTLPAALSKLTAPHLTKHQLETLVKWKLKHGTFRPTLMALVTSNAPAAVEETSTKAFAAYRADDSASLKPALTALTQLKGVGPATASLLLSVVYPETIPFFSDEAFRWVFHEGGTGGKGDLKGWGRRIKYDVKEYVAFVERVGELCKRLEVKAQDVEMVGWVLGREALGEGVGKLMEEPHKGKVTKGRAVVEESKALSKQSTKTEKPKREGEETLANEPTKKRKSAKAESQKASAKSNPTAAPLQNAEEEGSLRRSKRLRSS